MRAIRVLAVSLGVAASLLAGRRDACAGADGADGPGPLAAELLAAAQRLTGLPVPDLPPPVRLLPASTVADLACAGRCRGVGAYVPDQGILLDRSLDPAGSVHGRALLLHELVLYAEEHARADPGLEPCVRYEFWERRAYAAQHAYLGADGLGQVTLASPERWLTGCGRPPTAGPTEVASR